MAVSGADWRKSADRYRTDAAFRAGFVRPGIGGLSAVSGPPTGGCRSGVDRTLADDTDRSGNSVALDTVETDEPGASKPLAIGVVTGTGSTTALSDDSHADTEAVDSPGTGTPAGHDRDGNELYLRFLYTRFGYSTRRVGRRPIHDGAPNADERRRKTMDHTVIIK
jgi:hypothetical protein